MRRLAAVAAVAALLASGCAGVTTRGAEERRSASAATAGLEGEALLLLMADQLLFEPFGVRRIFRERPDLHERLAVTLGRVGDPRGRSYLEALVADPAVEVRRAAVFGLGLLNDPNAYAALVGALVDRDREVGRLAVDGMVRLGVPLAQVLAALESLPQDEWMQRLLPSLFRFSPDDIHEFEQGGRTRFEKAASPELERWLLFALARGGDGRGLTRLRLALDSPDPWSRGWAARALGRLGDSSDMDRLRPLLDADDPGVIVQALRAGYALVDSGRAGAAESWYEPLALLARDPRSWVRLTAVETAGAWPLDRVLRGHLRLLASGADRAAELALAALARAEDVESQQLIAKAAASSEPGMRRAAAAAAGTAGPVGVLEGLRNDPESSVRVVALSVLVQDGGEALGTTLRESLLDADPGVRTVALDWLTANPVAPLDELLLGIGTGSRRLPDLEISGAAALAARAAQEPLERGAAVAALERLARDEDYLVRRAAGRGLEGLDRPVPPLGSVSTTRTLRAYRAIADSTERDRFAEIQIEQGRIVVKLECRLAPLTCLSFLQLAQARFYDGLRFHRVIPDFVAQGGDPRGDGWGGPGFTLRDEASWVDYERGVVGMARSDTHTAGSQFFLTLSPQPHLTGRYTVFGRVVAGDELLDEIEQGDAIVRIREIEPASEGAGKGLR